MATSSIFTNVIITDPQKAETFIEALDASADEPKASIVKTDALVTDVEKIKKIISKRNKS